MPQPAPASQNNSSLSLTGKHWKLRQEGLQQGAALARQLNVPEITGRILANRGITLAEDGTAAEAFGFLSPNLKDLPDPSHLLDMDVAVARLINCVKNKEKIAVFGDYDVDGSCGSALLARYFKALGLETFIYIPDRLSEGYGPNPVAMQRIKEKGANVVITVDCGCLAFEAMDEAKKLDLDVIITDHHQSKPEKPACVALVNPNRVDETSPATMLCGAGVAFYLVMALNRALREQGFFDDTLPEPDLKSLLDLVAIATICDMVPLTGVSRILAERGLKMLSQRRNIGFAALMETAGITDDAEAYHAGFVIGPRINAGGRISECDLGARLLSTDNPDEARQIAQRLEILNEERKQIEQQVLEEAQHMAEEQFSEDCPCLVLANKGWHAGVIGIVASRIKALFHRPVFIISLDGETCKGSGRSIKGIDLGRAVIDAGDVLLSGGGHAMAAGISLEQKNIAAFQRKLGEHIAQQAEAAAEDVFIPRLSIDGFLALNAINGEFMAVLDRLAPYGTANPEPCFAFSGVSVAYAKTVGGDNSHVTFTLRDNSGATLRGIAFRAMESNLGPALLGRPEKISLCGTLSRNKWQGVESFQLQLKDGHEGVWQG